MIIMCTLHVSVPTPMPACRYVVPAASAAGFEAALEQQQGPNALAALTGKHLYCSLPLPLLRELGVKRFLQMPGFAVLTYPVSAQTDHLCHCLHVQPSGKIQDWK